MHFWRSRPGSYHGRAGRRSDGAAGVAHAELGRRQGKPSPGYIFVNLGYSFLAAAAGGYVTAWLAAANPLYHVLALGDHRARARGLERHAIERQAANLVSADAGGPDAIGVLAGGLVRLRVMGILSASHDGLIAAPPLHRLPADANRNRNHFCPAATVVSPRPLGVIPFTAGVSTST